MVQQGTLVEPLDWHRRAWELLDISLVKLLLFLVAWPSRS
jgi:hypothetical protein